MACYWKIVLDNLHSVGLQPTTRVMAPYKGRDIPNRGKGGTMNKQELVGAFAIAAVALLGLLLSTSILLAADPIPGMGPVPKADCGPSDRTEGGLQGQVTPEERFSGDSELGYNCNLKLLGQQPQGAFEGAFSQNGNGVLR